MINARELRIGNLIDQGEVIEIRQNHARIKYTSDKERNSLIDHESLTPIPLTEEILLKCGFIVVQDNPRIMELQLPELGHEGVATYYQETKCLTLSMFGGDYYDDQLSFYDKIKNLHQLQNIAYSLTNTEIKINI